DRYRRLAAAFASTIAAVDHGRWDNRTPCEDWTARDLVGHMVDAQGMFLGFIGHRLPDLPRAADDPAGAWDGARPAAQAGLDDPAQASTTYTGMLGENTFEGSVDQFLSTDLVLHRWDLARATGQSIQLDRRDMADVRASMAPLADKMRGPRA